MTADNGYIKAWFRGPAHALAAFRTIADHADRQNQFSCGLSWLDDLDCEDQVESDSISYDSIGATQEFLAELLAQLPELQFEGTLEHSWPILPCTQTLVEFSSENGTLVWNERCEELTSELNGLEEFWGEDDEDGEFEIPLTPYD